MFFCGKKQNFNIHAAIRCHIGRRRQNNEENFCFAGLFMTKEEADRGYASSGEFLSSVRPVFAVCDGMGGEENGERAAFLAASALKNANGKSVSDWEQLFEEISQSIFNDLPDAVQGCTAALIACEKNFFRCINVGDSRIYLFRHGRLNQVSQDHSPVYDLFLSGAITKEEARLHPRAYIISRYLGMDYSQMPRPFITQSLISVHKDDTFLICSDGLSDMLSDKEISLCLKNSESPDHAAQLLLEKALSSGGRDNITIIVLTAFGPGSDKKINKN